MDLGRATPEQRKESDSSAECKIQQERIRVLSRVVSFMIYPDGPYRWKEIQLDNKGILFQSRAYSEPLHPDGYPCNSDYLLFQALRNYCSNFRKESLGLAEERFNLLNLSAEHQDLINKACQLAKWPYKLGAALYLHQQMVAKLRHKEPSQGKAQWLVTNAPIKERLVEGVIPLRPDGGKPTEIAKLWKRYYSVADFWAAFVVWARTPLDFPTDRFVLLDFISNADIDVFLGNAALFRKFRAELKITRTKKTPLINQFGARDEEILDGVAPSPDESIPDLLDKYQWAALERYETPTRPKITRL